MGKVKSVLLEKEQKINHRWYRRLTNYLGNFIVKKRPLYYILSYTWGLLGVLVGWLILLCVLPFGKYTNSKLGFWHFEFRKTTNWGFSIGKMIFTGKSPDLDLLAHEYGHTVHNAIFGPFVFILVSIPSFIRFWYRNIVVSKRKYMKSYDAVWFEGTATKIGQYWIYNVNFDKL